MSISDVCPLLAFAGILYHPAKYFLIISIVVTAVVTTWVRIMRTAAQISGFKGILYVDLQSSINNIRFHGYFALTEEWQDSGITVFFLGSEKN